MRHIPIHLLESFVVFSEAKHMQEAASRLGLTQSALSKQLAFLAEQLPQELFTFVGRKKVLTKYGQELADRLKLRLSGLEDEIDHVNRNFGTAEKASVRVAARREILERIAHKIQFAGQIDFIDSSSGQMMQDLLSRRIDIGLVNEIPDSLYISAQKLFADEFVILAPKAYALESDVFNKKMAKILSEKPMIVYSGHELFGQDLLETYGFEAKMDYRRRYSNWRSICQMVEAGLGWSMVPDSFLPMAKGTQVIRLPKEQVRGTAFYLVYLKEMNSIPWFKDLKSEFLALK